MATEDYVDDSTKESASSLKADFQKLRSDLYGLFQDAVGFGKSGAGNVRSVAGSKLSETTDSLRGQYEHAKDLGIDGVRSIEDKIEKNPLAAIAIAAGVGLIVGGLIRRR